MASLVIELPDNLVLTPDQSPEEFVNEMRVAAAIQWYSQARISQGRAASIAGLDRTMFLLALGRAKVEAFQITGEELKAEVEYAIKSRRQRIAADRSDESRSAG